MYKQATILVIKDGSRLCNDGKLRSFALFGNMPGCVKVYRFEGRARAAAARMGGQVVAVPPGMRIEAGGVVIETVPCDPPPGMSGKGVNYVRHIRHQLEEFVREPVRRELGSA